MRQTARVARMRTGDEMATFHVLDVLTRSGDERDAFHALLAGEPEVDAALVSDVLRASGRVSATRETRSTLVALAGILRSLDAFARGAIEATELHAGLDLHASRTDRFASFGSARVVLRTMLELLEHAVAGRGSGRVAREQVALLDAELRSWFEAELLGRVAAPPTGAATTAIDPRGAHRLADVAEAARLDEAVRELLDPPQMQFFTGLAGACWTRGWVAVPIAGEQLGEDPAELAALVGALRAVGIRRVVQLDLSVAPRWRIEGSSVVVLAGVRSSYTFHVDDAGMAAAAAPRRALAVLTTSELEFAYVERDEHHVVAGPLEFIRAFLGDTAVSEANARFRTWVEELADDDDPPEHLLEAATNYARASRRGLGTR